MKLKRKVLLLASVLADSQAAMLATHVDETSIEKDIKINPLVFTSMGLAQSVITELLTLRLDMSDTKARAKVKDHISKFAEVLVIIQSRGHLAIIGEGDLNTLLELMKSIEEEL